MRNLVHRVDLIEDNHVGIDMISKTLSWRGAKVLLIIKTYPIALTITLD